MSSSLFGSTASSDATLGVSAASCSPVESTLTHPSSPSSLVVAVGLLPCRSGCSEALDSSAISAPVRRKEKTPRVQGKCNEREAPQRITHTRGAFLMLFYRSTVLLFVSASREFVVFWYFCIFFTILFCLLVNRQRQPPKQSMLVHFNFSEGLLLPPQVGLN